MTPPTVSKLVAWVITHTEITPWFINTGYNKLYVPAVSICIAQNPVRLNISMCRNRLHFASKLGMPSRRKAVCSIM